MTNVRSSPATRTAGRLIAWLRSLGALLILAPLLCALPAFVVFQNWSEATALAKEWTLEGPPCPVVDKPSRLAIRRKRPMTMQYGGATFTRSFAAVSCGAVPINPYWPSENYYVCRFNNPGAVVVQAAGRRVTFEPPVGEPATITVRRGQVSCAVAGGFAF
jgi:hypothetical protein